MLICTKVCALGSAYRRDKLLKGILLGSGFKFWPDGNDPHNVINMKRFIPDEGPTVALPYRIGPLVAMDVVFQ
jgi:hypothetical protein